MFCNKCGKEISNENAIVCPNCGCAIEKVIDKTKGGHIALSILLPLVGLIIGIVCLTKKQTKAGWTYITIAIIAWICWSSILPGFWQGFWEGYYGAIG